MSPERTDMNGAGLFIVIEFGQESERMKYRTGILWGSEETKIELLVQDRVALTCINTEFWDGKGGQLYTLLSVASFSVK